MYNDYCSRAFWKSDTLRHACQNTWILNWISVRATSQNNSIVLTGGVEKRDLKTYNNQLSHRLETPLVGGNAFFSRAVRPSNNLNPTLTMCSNSERLQNACIFVGGPPIDYIRTQGEGGGCQSSYTFLLGITHKIWWEGV